MAELGYSSRGQTGLPPACPLANTTRIGAAHALVSPTLSRSSRSGRSNFVATVLCLILVASVSTACQSLFGYYDSPIQNPLDRHAQMQEHARYANATMAVRWWREDDWAVAREAGLRVIVNWPHEFWLAVDENRPLILDAAMWCRMPAEDDPGWCNQTSADWLNVILAHQDQIAAVSVVDEHDCGAPFPAGWTVTNCQAAARKIEANIAAVRFYLPGIPTWVNYTSAFANWFQTSAPSRYGVSLASADWVGFDSYTPWEACWGRVSCPTLIAGMERFMAAHQKIALIPRAFAGSYLNWNPPSTTVASVARQYLSYMQTHPRVVGMFPFIWWDLMGSGTGAEKVPVIRTAYEQIGMAITGRPGPPPPPAPTGLRILRES